MYKGGHCMSIIFIYILNNTLHACLGNYSYPINVLYEDQNIYNNSGNLTHDVNARLLNKPCLPSIFCLFSRN